MNKNQNWLRGSHGRSNAIGPTEMATAREIIRKARLIYGNSHTNFARAIGLPPGSVRMWFSEGSIPLRPNYQKLVAWWAEHGTDQFERMRGELSKDGNPPGVGKRDPQCVIK